MLGLMSIQPMLDLTVAGVSLMFGIAMFASISCILCSAAFLIHAKEAPT